MDTGKTMKKIILPLLVLVLSSACAPKDVEVLAKSQRDKLNQKTGPKIATGEVKLGSYGLAAFMMEKQGEVLQLLSTSQLTRSQVSGAYTVDESSDSTKELQKIILSAANHTTIMPDFTLVQNAKWDNTVLRDESGKIQNIFARSVGEAGSVQKLTASEKSKSKDQAITLSEKSANIIVAVAPDDVSLSDVIYLADGSLEISKDGLTEVLPFKLNIKMRVMTAQLQESAVEILKTEITLNLIRNNGAGANMNVTVKANDGDILKFKNDKDCPLLLGQAVIISDSKKKVVIFNEEAANVGTEYKSAHVECVGQRPTVDLSRILIY
jgi:hypothetical protein